MDHTVSYKCPNCDAGLTFDADKQKFCCEFCLSEFTKAELDATDSAKRAEMKAEKDAAFTGEMREYYCPNCGAEVAVDASTAADYCYYCHNPIVLSAKVSGLMKPDKIVPFKFGKDEAKETFLRFAGKKFFTPKGYFAPEQADKIQGVYYPFWVTDADADAAIDATGKIIRSWSDGRYAYTETSRYEIHRRGNFHFEDIVSSAISSEKKEMLEGILPYPADSHVDFSMPYLLGFYAKKRDIDREALTGEVRERMGGYAEQLFRDTAGGYRDFSVHSRNLNVHRAAWEYTLMPLWILTYERKGKIYTYAMNGYTGKVYGELPLSLPKLFAFLGGLAAILTGLFGLIGGLFW